MSEPKRIYLSWLFFNILLPLTPVFVKLIILLFGDRQSLLVNILDSTELLYYSFIICIILLYDLSNKSEKSVLESLMAIIGFFIAALNIAVLVLIYMNKNAALITKIYALIIAALIVIVSSIIKWREVNKK